MAEQKNGHEAPRFWPLLLVLPGRFGRWWTGAGLLVLMGGLQLVPRLDESWSLPNRWLGPTLFFCVITAYIVPVFHYIVQRSRQALDDLLRTGLVPEAPLAAARAQIGRGHWRWQAGAATAGLLAGSLQNILLYGGPVGYWRSLSASPEELLLAAATLLVWVLMTSVVGSLVRNAFLFRRLAEAARVTLLTAADLRPFAQVAMASTLALIGAQAAFPLLFLGGEAQPMSYVPGFIATAVPMVFLLFLPVLPIRRRIQLAKRAELAALRTALREVDQQRDVGGYLQDLQSLHDTTGLLSYRREVQAISEWPFDLGLASRLGFYLVIPPLTWVGAALIENLVDALL